MKRGVLDTALLSLLLLLMSLFFLPKVLHEALGLLMGGGVLLHLVWNRGWLFSLSRGRWNLGRAFTAAVNFALAMCFLLALLSGLAIADQLFHGLFGLAWQRSSLVHQVHITAAYGLLILAGLHLGLHGAGLWRRFALWAGLNASSRCIRGGLYVTMALTVPVGIYGSFLHRIGDRLLMKHFFGTAAMKLPFAAFLLVLLGIVSLYAGIGYAVGKIAANKKRTAA
ncbi:MAG: DUF4405 domain-containing protein [Desulfovibrionaceae bacterium]|nr:DUF4405 domain-containing protein [Desulfovibrionaceae bacterium]